MTRVRPAGETGGHTVQDWEQVERTPRALVEDSSRATTASEPTLAPQSHDMPSPAVDPIYLRPKTKSRAPALANLIDTHPAGMEVGLQPDTLVDAITRGVLDLLAESLHAAVATAVRSLAPQMTISMPAAVSAPDRSQPLPEGSPPLASQAVAVKDSATGQT